MSRQLAVLTFALLLPLSAFGKATFFDAELDGSEAHEMIVENGNVYIGDAKGGMLYIGPEDQFYMLDHEDEVAILFNEEDAAGMADSMMSKMEKELANMPADQAAALRAMIKQKMPRVAEKVKSEARSTGESDNVNGFPCKEWIVSIGGKDSVKNCVASPSKLKISKADYQAVRAAFKKMESVFSSFSRVFGNDDPGFGFGDIEGIPVKVESLQDSEVSLLEKITNEADSRRTALPENYDVQSMADAMTN